MLKRSGVEDWWRKLLNFNDGNAGKNGRKLICSSCEGRNVNEHILRKMAEENKKPLLSFLQKSLAIIWKIAVILLCQMFDICGLFKECPHLLV